jgi:hypothetical protein
MRVCHRSVHGCALGSQQNALHDPGPCAAPRHGPRPAPPGVWAPFDRRERRTHTHSRTHAACGARSPADGAQLPVSEFAEEHVSGHRQKPDTTQTQLTGTFLAAGVPRKRPGYDQPCVPSAAQRKVTGGQSSAFNLTGTKERLPEFFDQPANAFLACLPAVKPTRCLSHQPLCLVCCLALRPCPCRIGGCRGRAFVTLGRLSTALGAALSKSMKSLHDGNQSMHALINRSAGSSQHSFTSNSSQIDASRSRDFMRGFHRAGSPEGFNRLSFEADSFGDSYTGAHTPARARCRSYRWRWRSCEQQAALQPPF